jgi:hypothetical protein
MRITPHPDFTIKWKNIRCFAAVVRSREGVRNAFEGHRGLSWWWKMVLALHGKPVVIDFSMQARCQCIADAFRFYGWLYRALAMVFGVTAFLCWVGNITDLFWVTLLAASAVYLWIASGLAFSGAVEFQDSAGERIWQLVAFLFFIALFLTSVSTAISIQVRFAGWLPDALNFAFMVGSMALGVGSYLVELAALVTRETTREARLN